MLVAPLDWGLGHTTRCIPLIRHLDALGAGVVFAGTAAQRAFIGPLFPHLDCLPLRGYDVTYSKTGSGFLPKLLAQAPRLLRAVRDEHRWLLGLTARRRIDGILSDNRYGLWHPQLPAVVLTHQLRVQTGLGAGADVVFQAAHYRLLERFGACWVVDAERAPGLSGILAHPARLPRKAQYLGPLSQFEARPELVEKTHLLVLLSGPEPQRTLLSDLLWPQVRALGQPVVFVEGKKDVPVRSGTTTVRWLAQASGGELESLLNAASYVICRSGYSTIMDAAVLGSKLIAISTPGQTEQEYLGRMLQEGGKLLCRRQQQFSVQEAIRAAADFPYQPLYTGLPNAYEPVLEQWLEHL